MERFQQHGPLQCVIHQTASHLDADDHLVSPQNHDSWTALLEAAKVRNHAPLLDISKHLEHLLHISAPLGDLQDVAMSDQVLTVR